MINSTLSHTSLNIIMYLLRAVGQSVNDIWRPEQRLWKAEFPVSITISMTTAYH